MFGALSRDLNAVSGGGEVDAGGLFRLGVVGRGLDGDCYRFLRRGKGL